MQENPAIPHRITSVPLNLIFTAASASLRRICHPGRALYGQLGARIFQGACIFVPRIKQYPIQDSSHYKHHTTSLKVAGIESSRAYVRIPRNLLHGGLRLYQQLTHGRFITWFEKPSMRWYIHPYIFTSLLCEIYCILQNSVYNI